MTTSSNEGDPTKIEPSYARRLQELANQQAFDFWHMAGQGRTVERAGTGERQRLPLVVTVEGQPMDVLFTVSVGSTVDEYGRPQQIGYHNRNGAQNAVEKASKNYAVVRTPYSDEQPHLVELQPADIATLFRAGNPEGYAMIAKQV